MRKFLLFFSIVIMITLGSIGFNINSKTRLLKNQVVVIKDNIQSIQTELSKLEEYKTIAPVSVEELYIVFMNNIKVAAALNKVTPLLKSNNKKGDFEIEDFCIDSKREGVKKMLLEMVFSEIKGEWVYLKLLNFFEDLEKQLPVEFVSVQRGKKVLYFTVNLYGV